MMMRGTKIEQDEECMKLLCEAHAPRGRSRGGTGENELVGIDEGTGRDDQVPVDVSGRGRRQCGQESTGGEGRVGVSSGVQIDA